MEKVKTIASIKNDIERHVGQKVTLKANGGRKKILVNDGIIESVYPSIFVIRLKDDTQRTVTYSYSDVLTKTVQLVFPSII
ncbi:Veg family protein [Clostridium saccharoperbutylacetonicum]|uniref:Veg family protein n=1 Tax=Clostridium saccharoperbutylacetonicum TaxID=36745 RepID=UPI0039ED3786